MMTSLECISRFSTELPERKKLLESLRLIDIGVGIVYSLCERGVWKTESDDLLFKCSENSTKSTTKLIDYNEVINLFLLLLSPMAAGQAPRVSSPAIFYTFPHILCILPCFFVHKSHPFVSTYIFLINQIFFFLTKSVSIK